MVPTRQRVLAISLTSLALLTRGELPAQTYTVLHAFSGPDGSGPAGSLLQGTDGNLYGVTMAGGDKDDGTVFQIDTLGNLVTLHSFSGPGVDGGAPLAGLLQGADGNFYGTTSSLRSAFGSVFQMHPSGYLTTLHWFGRPPDGADPAASLIQTSDGLFYGTTEHGGISCEFCIVGGTVYQMDSSGNVTILHRLSYGQGLGPWAPLVRASDDYFYGTASLGGTSQGVCAYVGCGTVFRIDSSGTLSVLRVFEGSDGSRPHAGLIQASDGALYGTTVEGGGSPACQRGCGTIFKIETSGTFTVLHAFDGADGETPFAGLIQAADGDLYGTTSVGGAYGAGTIFKMDSSGALTTLYTFTGGSDGAGPGGLVQGTDGNFYGVAGGGAGNSGVVFAFGACVPPTAVVFGSQIVCAGSPATIGANLTGTPPWTVSWSDGQIDDDVTSSPDLRSVSPSSTSVYTAAVSSACGAGTSASSATVTVSPRPVASATGTTTICPGGSAPLTGSGGVGCLWSPSTGLSDDRSCEPIAAPSSTTTYSLVVTDVIGCSSTNEAAVTITVSPDPAPTLTLTHCIPAGASGLVASVPGAAGDAYAWTVTGGTITSGQGTNEITFTSGDPGLLLTAQVVETSPAGCAAGAAEVAQVDYADVPPGSPIHDDVCAIGRAEVTAGCGGGDYCADLPALRKQMAVFVLKSKEGPSYVPPPATGIFADVPASDPFAPWIEDLYHRGVVAGCGAGPAYCPNEPVLRQQMAVFLLKTLLGSDYVPPACAGIFLDVPCSNSFAPWIEDLYNRSIAAGCGSGNYCPTNPTTRGQMSVFLVKTFTLP